MATFSKERSFSVDVNQSQFIYWFRKNVDKPKLLDKDIKKSRPFYGEISEDQFWIKKKGGIAFKSSIPTFTLDFSEVTGFIELVDGKVQINVRTSLNRLLRNILLIGIFLQVAFGISRIIGDNNFELYYILSGFIILSLSIWRVRLDAKFLQDFLISELKKESL